MNHSLFFKLVDIAGVLGMIEVLILLCNIHEKSLDQGGVGLGLGREFFEGLDQLSLLV